MLRYSYPQIVLQEIPGELTLALSISGCPLKCKGCHSTETWDPNNGADLDSNELQRLIVKNKHISCVLFYGGEWNISELIILINLVRSMNLKVALYSGYNLEFFPESIISILDFLKVGPYKANLGGLDSSNTNQRLFSIKNNVLAQILPRIE